VYGGLLYTYGRALTARTVGTTTVHEPWWLRALELGFHHISGDVLC
jgi:hypothetical protein